MYELAAQAVEADRQRRSLTAEQHALPPTLVATFQAAAYQRLLERAGVVVQAANPGRGGSGTRGDRANGFISGVPVRLVRISVGAPAAALVLEEAIARGVRTVLVVGSAGSLQRDLPIGSTVIVEAAEREDGTSHHYLPAGEVVEANPGLAAMLEAAAEARGVTPVRGRSWTIDAPYRVGVAGLERHRAAGVAVIEMEAAAIFAVARVHGVRAALIVAVSDALFEDWTLGFSETAYLNALVSAADVAMDVAAQVETGDDGPAKRG